MSWKCWGLSLGLLPDQLPLPSPQSDGSAVDVHINMEQAPIQVLRAWEGQGRGSGRRRPGGEVGLAKEMPRAWFSRRCSSRPGLRAALIIPLSLQSEPRVRLVMAQHMIRDIQTLLSRMEVSGQRRQGALPPFSCLVAVGQGHVRPHPQDSFYLIWSLICDCFSFGR